MHDPRLDPVASAHRALMRLAPERMSRRYKSPEAFEEAVERIDLINGPVRLGPALLGALAVYSFDDAVYLYGGYEDLYLAAATAVELDSYDMRWQPLIDDKRLSVDDIASVLELMLIEAAEADAGDQVEAA